MATGAVPAFTRTNWTQPHQLLTKTPNTEPSWVVVDHKENIAHERGAQVQKQTFAAQQRNDQGYHFIDSTDASGHDGSSPQTATLRNPGTDRFGSGKADREFADIESQLKEATQEVARLRAEARKSATCSEATTRHLESTCNVGDHESPAPDCHSQASSAALLQLEHEKAQLQQSCLLDVSMHDAPVPMQSRLDYLGLQVHKSGPQITSVEPAQASRKPSHADMDTHGIMSAIGQNFPLPAGSGGGPSTSHGTASTHTTCGCAASHTATIVTTEAEVGDDSVIVSPGSGDHERSDFDPVSTLKGSPGTKLSPRFAQPTMAFTRRAGETIRKDSVTSASKTVSTVKPSSIRSPIQKQQKRKALPGDWFGNPPEPASPNSQKNEETQTALHLDGCHAHQEPVLRKKTSTYMSPTKAATQRTLATTGQESAIPSAPRLPRNHAKLSLNTDMTSCNSAAQVSSLGSPETAIETNNIVMRKLQVQPRQAEKPKVAIPRRLTVTGVLPHSRQLPANTSISDLLAMQAKAAGLPMPANTTTQRRGSHGHLLIPIKAKLDKIGVLKDNPQPANLRRDSELLSPLSQHSDPELFSPLTRTTFAVQAALPDVPVHQVSAAPAVSPPNAKKIVPPHVRAAMRVAAAAAEAKRTAAVHTPSLRATAIEFTPMIQSTPQQGQMTNITIAPSLPELQQHGFAQPPPPFPTAICNTAPQAQGHDSLFPPAQGLGSLLNLQALPLRTRSFTMGSDSLPVVTDMDAMKFYDDEEWSSLTNWDRKRICERREILRALGRMSNSSAYTQTLVTTSPDIFHGKPITVQAGAVLTPNIDPFTKAVSWTLQSGNDNKVPISFGRGASPPIGPQAAAEQVRPLPVFTSPRTPAPAGRSWTIGSEQARQVYGWKGGDGREIKFVGHGPDAEREHDNGIRFKYHSRLERMGRSPRMVANNGPLEMEEDPSEAPLAPRGRRQWAQLAGSPRQPCDKVDIVSATEQLPIPFQPALHGFCNGCAVSSH